MGSLFSDLITVIFLPFFPSSHILRYEIVFHCGSRLLMVSDVGHFSLQYLCGETILS